MGLFPSSPLFQAVALLAGCGALALAACGDSNTTTFVSNPGTDGGDPPVDEEGGTTSEAGMPIPRRAAAQPT